MPGSVTPRVAAVPRPVTGARASFLHPLDLQYARLGIAPPRARRMPAARIPTPYTTLLVHENDMTRTLERHVGGPVTIRVLSAVVAGRWYSRRVLIVDASTGQPVAMAAIRIRIDAFSAQTRARILKGQTPLGRVLREGKVDYVTRPSAFFEVAPNAEMMGLFWMPEPRALYGRQTQMMIADTRIGTIVEILRHI